MNEKHNWRGMFLGSLIWVAIGCSDDSNESSTREDDLNIDNGSDGHSDEDTDTDSDAERDSDEGDGDDTEADGSDYEAWVAKAAAWPEWAEPLEPEASLEEVGTNMSHYHEAYASYEGAIDAVRSFRYLVENGEGQEYYLFWKMALGAILELLREDHLASKQLQAVLDSGADEIVINRHGEDYPLNLKIYVLPIQIGILSRMGFIEEMDTAIETVTELISNEETAGDYRLGDFMIAFAKAYHVTGQPNKAIDALAGVGDESLFLYPSKMASSTVGAASIAFRLGRYDDVLSLTQWMIDEGLDSQKYIENPENTYYIDQWQSSFKQIEQWRALAEANSPLSVDGLVDGSYQIEAQGFRGMVVVDVTIADRRIDHVVVSEDHVEDRPITALVTLTERWIASDEPLAVDAISGATVTSGAVEYAIVKAMAMASSEKK
jgi:uncharacterized protein with FMN-binding domain